MNPKIRLLLGLLLLAGCRTAPGRGGDAGVLRIGYQKGGALHLLRVNGDLDRRLAREGVRVEWVPFPSAPPMLEAIGVGSLDLGIGGDAPIVFAQAAGYKIALLANQPPADGNSRGILVPAASTLRSVRDLKGKRIAISKGTGTHNYLIQVLERGGVPYDRIQPVYLAPPDARAAFDAGKVDAWAAWDPYLTAARRGAQARTLVGDVDIVTAGGFYFSSPEFARKRAPWIRTALEEIDRTGVWLWQHPHEAAVALSPQMGVDVPTLEALQRNAARGRQYVGFRPIDPAIVAAQQQVADTFLRIGLLPRKVDVRESLLTPAEYAALLPSARTPVARSAP